MIKQKNELKNQIIMAKNNLFELKKGIGNLRKKPSFYNRKLGIIKKTRMDDKNTLIISNVNSDELIEKEFMVCKRLLVLLQKEYNKLQRTSDITEKKQIEGRIYTILEILYKNKTIKHKYIGFYKFEKKCVSIKKSWYNLNWTISPREYISLTTKHNDFIKTIKSKTNKVNLDFGEIQGLLYREEYVCSEPFRLDKKSKN